MLRYYKILSSIILLLALFSCKNSNKSKIASVLHEWDGKEVLFPKCPVFTIQGKDTVSFSTSAKFKILTYIDSAGCLSCKLHLDKWKELINELDSTMPKMPKFLFFFSPEKKRDLLSILKIEQFLHPICIDEEGTLNSLNHFPTEMAFQTFLLDENNKVLAIGNPVHNYKVKELYLKIIQGKDYNETKASDRELTNVEISNRSFDLGEFDFNTKQATSFTLTNTGSKPLVIHDVNTSCGCTTVEYPKEPVRPKDSATLRVIYKADEAGFFNKTITVHCNTLSAPIQLTISGDAKK